MRERVSRTKSLLYTANSLFFLLIIRVVIFNSLPQHHHNYPGHLH